MIKSITHYIQSIRRLDIVYLLLLIAAALHFVWGMGSALDIEMSDESLYLYSGLKLPLDGFPEASWSPIYSAWYFLLSTIKPNAIDLYFLNSQILVFVCPILLFVILCRYSVSTWLALLLSYVFLLTVGSAFVIPRIGQFTLLLIELSILLMSFFKQDFWIFVVAALCSLFISFVRPEFFLAYSIFIVLLIFYGFKSRVTWQKWLCACLLIVIQASILISFFGFPLAGGRSFFAFAQHFALHWTQWTQSSIEPWNHWGEIYEHYFCKATSIAQVAACSPHLFLKHVLYNALAFFPRIIFLALPAITFSGLLLVNIAIACALLICVVWLIRVGYQQAHQLKANARENRLLLIVIGVFSLPILSSVLVIYTRNHYVLISFCLLLITLSVLKKNVAVFAAVGGKVKVLVLLLVLGIYGVFPAFPNQSDIAKPNRQTIQLIRSWHIKEPVNILEAEGGFDIYSGSQFKRVVAFDKQLPFDVFLREKNIKMIVATPLLMREARLTEDKQWHFFLANYVQMGFARISVPHTDRFIYVKQDLISSTLKTANNNVIIADE